jgi:hypothetical protein
MGNTPRIAMKHYLQVREEDFQRAAQMKPASQRAANALLQPAANPQEELSQNTNKPGARENDKQDISANPCESLQHLTEICYNVYSDKELSKNGEDRIRTCGPVSRSSV